MQYVINLIDEAIKQYYIPFSSIEQNETFQHSRAIKNHYLRLHHAVVQWIHGLSHCFGRNASSVIVYQLVAWQQWYKRYGELLELMTYLLAIYPYLLKTQHHHILTMISFPNESTDSMSIEQQEVIRYMNEVKSLITLWHNSIPMNPVVTQLDECMQFIRTNFNQINNHEIIINRMITSVIQILTLLLEVKDGDDSNRSVQFKYLLKPTQVTFMSTNTLDDIVQQYKLALQQAIYFNLGSCLQRDKWNDINTTKDIKRLVSAYYVQDSLYEERLIEINADNHHSSITKSPYLYDGICCLMKSIALRKQLIVSNSPSSGLVVGTLHSPSHVFQRSSSEYLYLLGKLYNLHGRAMSPHHFSDGYAWNVEHTDVYKRSCEFAKRGLDLHLKQMEELLIVKRIGYRDLIDHLQSEAIVDYFANPIHLISRFALRDKMLIMYQFECGDMLKLYTCSDPFWLMDVIETEESYHQQAIDLSEQIRNKKLSFNVDLQDDICIHRWGADICFYVSGFISQPEIPQIFEQVKYLHSLWFEIKHKLTTLATNNDNNATVKMLRMILLCIKIQFIVLSILNWEVSDEVESIYLQTVNKESLGVVEQIKPAMIAQWIELLKRCMEISASSRFAGDRAINSNLEVLEDCFFWLHKRVEVALLQIVLDLKENAIMGKITIPVVLCEEQYKKLDWIVQHGNDYSLNRLTDMYQNVQSFVRGRGGKKIDDAKLIAWFTGNLNEEYTMSKSITDRNRATLILTEVAKTVQDTLHQDLKTFLSAEQEAVSAGTFGKPLTCETVLSLFYKV